MRRLLASLLLCGPLSAQVPLNIVLTYRPAAQARFLYAHMRTEFSGCLYGHVTPDTVVVSFFISSITDPRTASDSSVQQGGCPNITTEAGAQLVGIMHSHIRRGAMCVPSHKDLIVLEMWQPLGAIFGAIMCARGDSVALFAVGKNVVVGLPPLDSLYTR